MLNFILGYCVGQLVAIVIVYVGHNVGERRIEKGESDAIDRAS